MSVALCTYNGAPFLEAQLQSLAEQTRGPDELVVVDDSSNDGTDKVLESFAARAPFPVVLERRSENQGWVRSYFDAIRKCSGDVIATCDQDDVWLPQKIDRCVSFFEQRRDLALVVHSATVVDDDLRRTPVRIPDFRRTGIDEADRVPLWFLHQGFALVFAAWLRDVFDTHHLPEEVSSADKGHPFMPHDYWACMVAPAAGPVAHVADDLALYRRHVLNASGQPVPPGRPTLWARPTTVGDTEIALPRRRLGGTRGIPGLLDLELKVRGYRHMARTMEGFADYLDEAASGVGAGEHAALRSRIVERARLHRGAARRLRQRADAVETSAGPGPRIGAVAALARGGGYGSKARGGLGLPSLALDLALAALGPRGSEWLMAIIQGRKGSRDGEP